MLRVIAFTIILTIAFIGGFINPFIALLGYTWFALFRPQEWLWFDVSGFRFSLFLGILLLVRSAASGYLPNLTHRHSLAMVGALGAAVLAHQTAIRSEISAEWLDFLFRLVVVALVAVSLVDSNRRLYWFVATMALSFGFHTTKAGLASILAGGAHYYEGLGGAFLDNNSYAIAGVMVMPLLWATAKLLPFSPKAARFTKPLLWATLPLTAFFVFSTFSRSGFIALGVALLSWLSLQRRKFRTVIGVLLLIMAVVPFLPMPEGYLDRLQTIRTFEEEQESSAISRLHFWKVAMSMVAAHPLGVGLFNFEANYDDFDTTDGAWGRNRSVHNSHLQILTELGVIGFALWVFLLISSLIGCLRIRRKADAIGMDTRTGQVLWTLATAIFVSLFAFMVGGLFISMGLNDLTWLMFAAVAALERVASHAANPPAPIVKRASLI